MCIFSKPKIDNTAQRQQQEDAKRARQEEAARQRQIDKGMQDIAALFEGGRYRSGTREVRERTGRPGIEVIAATQGAPSMGGENFDGATTGTPRQFKVGDKSFNTRAEAQEYRRTLDPFTTREKPVFTETEGLQPFLDQRREALEGFQFPQLDQQAAEAGEQIDFALARSGLMRSTVASDKRTDLAREMGLASAKIAADIDADIAQTRNRAEQERRALEAGLRSSGDRAGAADAATRAVENITSDAPNFSILPDLFGGVASSIGNVRQGFETGAINRRIDEVTRGFGGREGTVVR